MNDEEKNRIIAEALNLCWHEWDKVSCKDNSAFYIWECTKCDETWGGNNPPVDKLVFDSWPGFGLIMERGPGREWWKGFCKGIGFKYYYDFLCAPKLRAFIEVKYIDPPVMRDTLSLWLKEHEGEWREK